MRRRSGLRQFIERHNGANAHIDQGRFRAAAIDDLTDDVKKNQACRRSSPDDPHNFRS
jgi:hypothetical protein